MFNRRTVFIIGAGAGVDINMPTGAALIEEIARRVGFAISGNEMTQGNSAILDALRIGGARAGISLNELIAAGRNIAAGANFTRSIDSYIHTHHKNKAIKLCGKIAIVHSILDSERRSKVFVDQASSKREFQDAAGVRNSWLHTFMYLLRDGVQAEENLDDLFSNLTIINFNYDRCIEQFLWFAIQIVFLVPQQRATQLMSKLKIYHPYGWIAPLPWQSDVGIPLGGDLWGNAVDVAKLASNIRTYNEEVELSDELEIARASLTRAQNVVFLGFHFHKQNVEIIKPVESKRRSENTFVYATTLGRSDPEHQIIENLIMNLLTEARVNVTPNLMKNDCKALLAEFGSAIFT